MTNEEMKNLRLGDVVRNEGSGTSYIVISNYNNHVTVFRTVDIMNPSEWVVVKRYEYK